jgi:hypothetical protein
LTVGGLVAVARPAPCHGPAHRRVGCRRVVAAMSPLGSTMTT